MKSILISIRPEWVAKILNGEKTIEIRKTAPKCDLPIDVYIYCTKSKKMWLDIDDSGYYLGDRKRNYYIVRDCSIKTFMCDYRSGKVVAKFRLKKAEEFVYGNAVESVDEECVEAKLNHHDFDQLLKQAAMTREQLEAYAPIHFYAWEISDLEIFDEPIPLAALGAESAPQSWAYIESDREPIYARKGRCEAYCDGKPIGGNYILHITMNGSEIMHQKWAVMPTKAQAEEILAALNPEGI